MSEREIVTLVDGLRAHKLLVIGCGLLLGVLTGAFAWLTTPPAVATGSLGLTSPAAGNALLPLPTGDATMARYVAQRALFATSDVVLAQAAPSVPGTTINELREAAGVSPSKTGNALQFSVSGSTPGTAAILTKALMDAYREQTEADVQRRTEATAAALEASGDDAEADRIVAEGKSFGDGVEFEVRPSAAQAATRGILSKEAVLGLLAGLGAGAFIAWGLEDARQRRSNSPRARAFIQDARQKRRSSSPSDGITEPPDRDQGDEPQERVETSAGNSRGDKHATGKLLSGR
jgi:hypothetical protein